MNTTQIMKRDFNGNPISQRTSDKFFNATEMLALYNSNSETQKVIPEFWSNKNTQEFIKELENDIILNIDKSLCFNNKNISWESTRGRGGCTWMHPYLFMKFCCWLSPKFELQIIKWVYDNLIDFRVDAGGYYKDMCSALIEYHERNQIPTDPYLYAREATLLNTLVFNNPKAKQRNDASETELKLMNELQLYNIYLLNTNTDPNTRKKLLFERKNSFVFMNKITNL
jgi:KilA-N domain